MAVNAETHQASGSYRDTTMPTYPLNIMGLTIDRAHQFIDRHTTQPLVVDTTTAPLTCAPASGTAL